MRLKSLLIENYGVFKRLEIPLSVEPGTIDLVVAPNGAGKSMLRGAMHDLLFGIPLQAPGVKFRFGYSGMALHAAALLADGTDLRFGWHKQKGRLFEGDAAVEQRRFAGAIGALSTRQLSHLFALDTEHLRRGGEELAKGGTSLGVALLSGSGELASARSLQISLEDRRRALYEKRRSAPRLNAAARKLDEAARDLRNAMQRPPERVRREEAVAAAAQRLAEAEAAHRDARARSRRLARIDRTRQPLADLAAAQSWLAANPHAPRLPATLGPDLEAARTKLGLAKATLDNAARQLQQARTYLETLTRDEAALADQDALAGLAERVKSVEDARRDLPATREEAAVAARGVTDILTAIGTDVAPEAARALVPQAAPAAMARKLIREFAARKLALDAALEAKSRCEEEAADLSEQDADTPSDTSPLAALRQEIRDDSPLQKAREAERSRESAAAELHKALALVPGWTGDAAGLRAAVILPERAFERLARDVETAHATQAKHAAAHTQLAAEREAWARDLAHLRAARVAEPARLAAARAARDQGWRLIQARAFAGAPDLAAEASYAHGETLPVVFERHLREADTIADERATDSARVAEAERLDRSLADRADIQAAEAALRGADAALRAARSLWEQAVAPLGLDPGAGMAEVRACLTARKGAIEAASAFEKAKAEEDALALRHADYAARLSQTLGIEPGGELPALLVIADRTLAAGEAAEKRRQEMAIKRQTAQKALTRAVRRAEDAQHLMLAWRADWAPCLAALGRPAGEPPDITETMLLNLDELGRQLQELDRLMPRIASMEQALASFAGDTARLAARLGEAEDADPVVTARALARRLQQARDGATRWDGAQRAIETAARDHAKASEQHDKAQLARDALIQASGAATGEAADANIAASAERLRMERLRDASRRALVEHGEGLGDDALRAEAGEIDPAAMASARDLADAQAVEAAALLQSAAIAQNTAETELRQAAEATSAADAAAILAAAAAAFGQLLDEELVLRVASNMLAQAIDTVAKAAGDDAVGRISRAFASVTDGAYGVVAEDQAGTPILRATQAAFPDEDPCAIEALSEGTRDQLYLALRLVALEDFTATAPPLPFIADDILQTFDDSRALAAMRALIGLSRKVQVIVLTHHNHLAELSRALPAGSVFVRSL